MDIFGYTDDSEAERPSRMREVSFSCDRADLDRLIGFLEHVRSEAAQLAVPGSDALARCHLHLSDWARTQTPRPPLEAADVIVALGYK